MLKQVNIDLEDDSIVVRFPPNCSCFDELLAITKGFPVRKFNKVRRLWHIPRSKYYLRRLTKHFIANQVNVAMTSRVQQFVADEDKRIAKRLELKEKLPPGTVIPEIKHPLCDYQAIGFNFGNTVKECLIADNMGLGKTIQAICIARTFDKRTLVIAPATLKWNWEKELRKFLGQDFTDYQIITKGKDKILNKQFTIISYGLMVSKAKELQRIDFDVALVDESHFLKNRTSKRYKAVRKVIVDFEYIILISGTPMLNYPVELFTQLNLIAHQEFPKYWDFVENYCHPVIGEYGYDVNGSSNLGELRTRIAPYIIRRKKSEVDKELPKKIREDVIIELSPEILQEYNDAEREFVEWHMEHPDEPSRVGMARVHKLKQIANKEKEKRLTQMVDELTGNGERVVAFSQYKTFINRFESNRERKIYKITGDVPQERRIFVVEQFEHEKPNLLFGTTTCMGYGLNLQIASYCIFVDLLWTPLLHRQCEDRLHRKGQKKTVIIYRLIAKDTIDENIAERLTAKEAVIKQIIEKTPGSDQADTIEQKSIFSEVMLKLKAKYQSNK